VIELLKGVSIDTKWEELPADTKERLRLLAADRLAAYRNQWAAEALAAKEMLLLKSPTPKMISSIDRYYRTTYQTFLPSTFSVKDLSQPEFREVLVRNYLGVFAALRATLTYPDAALPTSDWDGESLFNSIRLPDRQTYEDIKAYNREVVETLRKIDTASLGELEKKLKQYVLFQARSNAEGSRGDSYGSDFMEQACDVAALSYDVLSGYEADHGRPKIFESDEAVLRELNALYLNNTPLKWLDVGTRASALSFCAITRDRIEKEVGDSATSDASKGMILLQSWWMERVKSAVARKCSIYSPDDRMRIWDAFSADQQFNNDGSSSMEVFLTKVSRYRTEKTAHYRDMASVALRLVFPDETVLTQDQQQSVATAVGNRTDFGLFTEKIAEELDAVQATVNGPAARLWKSALETNLEYVGGDYAADQPAGPNEIEKINAMFEEVKSWVARNYADYPIDISSLFMHIGLQVNTKNNAFTDNGTATVKIGVGTRRSKAEYYSWLLHELRHAVMYAWHANAPDKTKVRYDEGPALEGSGVAVEDLLLLPFLRETIKSDVALALYTLEYGIRDARFAGTTDATLQKYLRRDCDGAGDLDTIEFTKKIAAKYGLAGTLADTVAERAHAGTQYFQYIWAGSYMLEELAFLQEQVDPSKRHRLDPFILFACELNTPQRDKSYVDALKACWKL
jgi:hypothetical protein